MPEGKSFLVEAFVNIVDVELLGRSATGLLTHPRNKRHIKPARPLALDLSIVCTGSTVVCRKTDARVEGKKSVGD